MIYVSPLGNDANDGSSWASANATIGGGISDAVAGDEIWVADGIYGEQVIVKSGIALYGGFAGTETNREDRNWETNLTIIDPKITQPDAIRPAVRIMRGVGNNTILDGFVIKNGTGSQLGSFTFGGGIYCEDHASPTIANCVITENQADNGAGIFCYNFSRPVLKNNKIIKNTATDWGGGIYCWLDPGVVLPPGADPPVAVISGNEIERNVARYGGGIAVFGCATLVNSKPSAYITNNKINYNGTDAADSASSGGGIYLEYISPAIVSGNDIIGNSAGRGGGINCSNSTATITSNTVNGNLSTWGGGLAIYYSTATIANNEIATNGAIFKGAGIYGRAYSGASIVNNTVVANAADQTGGGIYLESSSPGIYNNVIAFNSDGGVQLENLVPSDTSMPVLKKNCVFGNGTTDYQPATLRDLSDMNVDPKFVSQKYGIYRLRSDSPCINAGGNQYILDSSWVDIDNTARIVNSVVDLGCDEYDGTNWADAPRIIVHVSPTGNDNADGESWDTAKATIQAAIDLCSKVGGEVWVSAGIYPEWITLRPRVQLLGGFLGFEESSSERDWEVNESMIYPPIQYDEFGMPYESDIKPAVTIMRGTSGVSTIDGFTISGAWAVNGGGIYCVSSSPIIRNNLIAGCLADDGGAGIFCSTYASPLIENNIIHGCQTWGMNGGAITVANMSSPRILNNRLEFNVSAGYGGGIYSVNECSPEIFDNIIEYNSAPRGSAIYCVRNVSTRAPRITCNTIVGNIADTDWGALTFMQTSPVVVNNIIANNSSGIRPLTQSSPEAHHNCYFENADYNYYGLLHGVGDIEADPLFVDLVSGDYHLQSLSPCIDAGDDSFTYENEQDIDYQTRIYGAHVDMGADEWRGLYNVSLLPNSGSLPVGTELTFTSTWSHPEGVDEIADCYLLINATRTARMGICLRYNQDTNSIYLRNDNNTEWLGGHEPGSDNVIENRFVKVYCVDTHVSESGDNLIIQWRIEAKPDMCSKGTCTAWMLVDDDTGLRDGWDDMRQFVFSSPPENMSFTPNSGPLPTGQQITLTSEFFDGDGYTDSIYYWVIINTSLDGKNAVHLLYNAKSNLLWVRNDNDTAWVGGYKPGSAYVIDNSQVRLYCANTTVSGVGGVRTIKWNVMIKPNMAGKTCGIWTKVQDKSGLIDDWTKMGEVKITVAPKNVSITPSKGNLIADRYITLACKYTDGDGNADLQECCFVMNTYLTGRNGVYVMYDAKANKLYLRNNENTEWMGGFTPGSNNTIQNSQCQVDISQTTVYRSGNDLTVYWKIKLKPILVGKTLQGWMLVTDTVGQRGGYDKLGLWSVTLQP
ncbi:MAG TPA: right-handed parallel beta-helix repeat-containing protein [Armatimonadota bacterium]|nr:right-handed parallel beta-helix repeat-containing protein [Armatimonadota bacterium]